MKIISIYILIAGSLYLITKPYEGKIDQILSYANYFIILH